MPDATELLGVEHLTVRFPSLLAVKGVSFSLHAGELLGLIGPNGAGKTTLLRAIAGLQTATAGSIRVLGEVMTDAGSRVSVGFTPDTPPLYENLTVRDFLRFVAKGYHLDDAEAAERIDFWLEKVWLSEKSGQKIASLSRGMRQRVGIARTLLPNPHVVLLDEPASGLDPAGRVQFRQLLIDLREQGKALIVSSHILSDMAEYCTHIGIMGKGQMVRFGTVADIASSADASAGPARCAYRLTLAHPAPRLRQLLEETEGIEKVETHQELVKFHYFADRAAAAALLSQLISNGVPVAAFAPDSHDLESIYLQANVGQVD